jgi:hypothetical protein
MKTKLINVDQRQRQDYLDMMDKKAIRREEQHFILFGCIACMLTIVMLSLVGMI